MFYFIICVIRVIKMDKCDRCGEETDKLVFVGKEKVCDRCFPKALKQLFARIERSNAELTEKRKKRWEKSRNIYKR